MSKKDKLALEQMLISGGIRRQFSQPTRTTTPAPSTYGAGNAPAAQDKHSAPIPGGKNGRKPSKVN